MSALVALILQLLVSTGGQEALAALFKDHGISEADLVKAINALPDAPAPKGG